MECSGHTKKIVNAGLCALCWAIWLNRNDIIFLKSQKQTYLQILFRATYLVRMWMPLQKEEDMDTISTACRAMSQLQWKSSQGMGGSLVIGYAYNLFLIYF